MEEILISRKEYDKLLKSFQEYKQLQDIVTEEILKPDSEFDLIIIGEKVVSYLGYWG